MNGAAARLDTASYNRQTEAAAGFPLAYRFRMEQVRPGEREIYIYYPEGMGRSKLKLPLNGVATTARNINTVAKLVAMTEA